MAFDQATRNLLQRTVAACRNVFAGRWDHPEEGEFTQQLQQIYGINPDGTVAPLSAIAHLSDEEIEIARVLRQTLDHYAAGLMAQGKSSAAARAESVARILREQAFTVLNRLAALRLAEERGLVLECVRQGMQSEGFRLFQQSAGSALGDTYETYQAYLSLLFGELAYDLGSLFDRWDPQGLLFPRQPAMEAVLRELNGSGEANYGGGEVPPERFAEIWSQDETIGWIYQYFNDPAERKKMRDESSAPRNSRELAVRNQFFTPRYVVEFLTDNTLGRLWYEMTRGDTVLRDRCRYLVRRPTEIFLKEGESAPESTAASGAKENLSQEDLLRAPVHIPHRPLKDPRTIRLLDPACGSMHFGLYAFDLFESIYDEAWEIAHGTDEALKSAPSFAPFVSYAVQFADKAAFLREVPRLIVEHNLHGIDIDPRAAQIAGLSLWLRAHRAWQRAGVKPADRPRITRSNLVCAEPMPGEKELLREFVEGAFPAGERPAFAFLLEKIFDCMTLAGEAGSLLRIEEEIRTAIAEARALAQRQSAPRQAALFAGTEPPEQEEFNLRGLTTDEQFWEKAEERIYEALETYAGQAENGGGFQRRLFAADAAQGFAFIDLCRKRYDVVVMNPPFGERPVSCEGYFQSTFPLTVCDFYSMFYERALGFVNERGKVGAITNRTWLSLPSFEDLRTKIFGKYGCIESAADLGSFVLDAQVETAAVIIGRDFAASRHASWIRLLKTKAKTERLLSAIQAIGTGQPLDFSFLASQKRFASLPSSVCGYWMSQELISLYQPKNSLAVRAAEVKVGLQTSDDDRFLRLVWEIPLERLGLKQDWARFAKGGEFQNFFDDVHLVARWTDEGKEIAAFPSAYIRNPSFFGLPGVTWPRRTTSAFGPRTFPAGCAFGDKGPVAFPAHGKSLNLILGFLTANPTKLLLSVRLGAGDDAPGSASKSYEVGLVKDLPFPDFNSSETRLEELARDATHLVRLSSVEDDETTACFIAPALLRLPKLRSLLTGTVELVGIREDRFAKVAQITSEIDDLVADALGFGDPDRKVLWEELERPLVAFGASNTNDELFRRAYLTKEPLPGDLLPGGLEAEANVRVQTRRKKQVTLRDPETICRLFEIPPTTFIELRRSMELVRDEDTLETATSVSGYALGCAFGRWDIRYATDERPAPELPDPFAPLPVCPLGMFQGDDGLPLSPEAGRQLHAAGQYPLDVAWDGILVDDPEHPLDLERRVHAALQVLWPERADDLEHEACALLGVPGLREWFRRPAGFFADHLRRYSKSRRQAPIYWPLSTPSGRYTLWLYYPRLNNDTLFKCLQEFVEPKLRDVENAIARFRAMAAADEGSAKDRKQLDEAEALSTELRAFRDEIAHWAPRWKPNLNDGVQITACPLWKLFRLPKWQTLLQRTWKELERGDYDWAHLALTLRPDEVRKKCETDRSIAIAHGLESLCKVEAPKPKAKRSKKAAKQGVL